MEDNFTKPLFEFAPVLGEDRGSFCGTIVSCFQLFIQGYRGQNNLLTACRKLCRVSIKRSLQIDKPVMILGDSAVVLKLRNVRWGNLDTLEIGQWDWTVRVGTGVAVVSRECIVIPFTISIVAV